MQLLLFRITLMGTAANVIALGVMWGTFWIKLDANRNTKRWPPTEIALQLELTKSISDPGETLLLQGQLQVRGRYEGKNVPLKLKIADTATGKVYREDNWEENPGNLLLSVQLPKDIPVGRYQVSLYVDDGMSKEKNPIWKTMLSVQ